MSLLAVNPTPAQDASRTDAGGATESAQVRALLQLRELILSGELAGGSRIAELAIVERLGVSRTPIRAALMRLEQEGLLEALPNGGYVVQTFSERDVADAIELRGTLEGLLARLARSHHLHRVALLQHAVDKPPQRHGHAIDFRGEGFCHDGNPQTGELRSEGLDEEVVGGFHTPETRHRT